MRDSRLISIFTRLRGTFAAKAQAIVGREAEDALQEAFCRLWSGSTEDKDERALQAVSFTAVRNASIDLLRRRKHLDLADELPDCEADEEDSTENLFQDVTHHLQTELSERDRDILMKREMYGYEYSDLAQEYGITEANVRMIISRARTKLRSHYQHR